MSRYVVQEARIGVKDVEALAPPPAMCAGVQVSDNVERTVSPPAPARSTDVLVAYRRELDAYWVNMRGFASMEPDQVLIALSAYTARVGEMRKNCWRDGGRLASKLRTEEIDPFIEECDRQFKFHSRLQSTRELDWQMTRGAPT